MKTIERRVSENALKKSAASYGDVESAKLNLLRIVIVWLLALFSLIILFVPVVAILLIIDRVGPAIGVGTFVAGALACVARLLKNTLNQLCALGSDALLFKALS